MKSKHNVILILVSSKWLIPYSGDSSKFLISFVHFSFRSSKLFRLYHFKASSNHCKASPGVLFNFPFRLIILLLSEFFMEDQHGGSSRIPFILQLFFKNSLEVMIRQAILKDKHGVLHMFCFEEFKHSSSCIPKCNSLYLIFWDGAMPFLTISFMFHDSQVVRNEIIKSIIFSSFKRSFQPINLFVGVVLGYISPIAFPKECSYLWCLSMI